MFRDKWIIRFFKFPFCGDFSLHLHKIVKEISRNITRAENFQRHVFELANPDINIACLLNGRKHRIVITRSCTNLMTKASKIQIKTKANPLKPRRGLHLYALLSHQTLSVLNSSYFPQVALCDAPGWDVLEKL